MDLQELIMNLRDPAGIAIITGILVQWLKNQFKLNKEHRYYSIIYIGFNIGVTGILSWLGYFLLPLIGFELLINDAFFNWFNAAWISTVGYQLIKGVGKLGQ